MEALLEKTTRMTTAELEAQQHNAQIKERYRKLQSAEADQFASDVYAEANSVSAAAIASEAPVYVAPAAVETPVMEQTPQVTEFVHERVTNPIFTTDKFDRIQDFAAPAPTQVAAPAYAPVIEEKRISSTAAEAQYSLSPLAKVVMAIFTFVVIAMLTLVCVNTQLIRKKSVRIKNLEEKRQELMEKNEEIQRRIDEARSEDAIRAYAESQGVLLG